MQIDDKINELYKFLKLIPSSIIALCMTSIDFINRDDRRKIEKIKNYDEKLRKILDYMPYRIQLIKSLHSEYNSDFIVSENLSYDNLLSLMNESNAIKISLYIFYRCCDDDYDKAHFDNFIKSEQLQKTIKKEWKRNYKIEQPDDKKGENKMIYYLGYIELRRTYYNFHPQYIFNETDKTIVEISKNMLFEKFPMWGSLNLAYERYKESHNFLKELDVEELDNEINPKSSNCIYAIRISDNNLEDSGDEKIKIKLDLQKLYETGIDLDKIIFPVNKFNMYKIVTPKEQLKDESFSSVIFIEQKDYASNEEVLLEYKNNLFGPYKLKERAKDGEKYVQPDSGLHGYVLKYYDKSSYEFISFEKEYYYDDSTYTDIAFIIKEPCLYDVISDTILLTKLQDDINFDLLKSNPDEFERLYSTSPLLGNISDEIRHHRIERTLKILNKIQEFDDSKSKALSTLIDSLGDKIFELLGDRIKDSKAYKDLKTNEQKLQNDIDELKNKEVAYEEENNILKLKVAAFEESAPTTSDTVVDNKKIDALENEISDLKVKLSLVDNLDKLKNDCDELESKYRSKQIEYNAKVREVDDKQKELENIQSTLQTFIKNELKSDTAKMLKTAFDPYISNAMIEAASNYQAETETDIYKKISEEMINMDCKSIERKELIDLLVNGVQKFRNYSKNDIVNMYICLAQGFLTVFSGEPGTGKTSICNILANSLGLNQFGEDCKGISKNRFIPVSVEKGWSTKRDLIGYFNPLTKKYDRSNAKIYDALMILNEERQKSRFPYVILLDEANLSPMEYYWADFMRAADKSDEDLFINIGLDTDIYIPNTLRFLATINNDQTTEQLSPRLIDRAWIIKLPKTSILDTPERVDSYFKTIVKWDNIVNVFAEFDKSKDMSLKPLTEQIYKLFDEHHLSVSPRIQQSIKKYVCVAQEIMEDEVGVCTKKEKALDFAIVQKLLPKINGYYKDYERLFASLKQICDENNLRMTKEALVAMEEYQIQNMGYCQYLV